MKNGLSNISVSVFCHCHKYLIFYIFRFCHKSFPLSLSVFCHLSLVTQYQIFLRKSRFLKIKYTPLLLLLVYYYNKQIHTQRTKCEIKLKQVYITPPVQEKDDPLLPHACRLRHYTYCAEAKVDIERSVFEVNEETHEESLTHEPDTITVRLGMIPVMVRSMLCTLTLRQIGRAHV
jgi:hypothetical protein